MNNTETTLQYYNQKGKDFAAGTIDVEFGAIQQTFTALLPDGASILDLGCGSGRDSKAFLEHGYTVTMVDGSAEMCRIAAAYTGQDVMHATFQDYTPATTFDGIWACSSLLHLSAEDIQTVMQKMSRALVIGGRFYVSFKYGDYSGMRNGRYFTDLNEERFARIADTLPGMVIEKQWITGDVRPGREAEQWLNVILKREA